MIRAIPKRLLIHNIEVQKFEVVGNENVFSEYKEIKNVRVEDKPVVTTDSYGARDVIAASLIFIDIKNSIPFNESDYVIGGKIRFNGKEMTIKAIQKDSGFNFHHLEIEVV